MTGETIAIIALGTALVPSVVALIALTWKLLGYHSTLQAMDDERDKAVQENASLKFELAAATKKIAEQDETIEVLAQEDYEVPTHLDPGDWRARVQLAAKAAAARRGALPAVADGDEVHPSGAADRTDTAEVPAGEVRPDGLMQP